MKTSKEERAARLWMRREHRKKVRIAWFQDCSVPEREWLQTLADAYKSQLAHRRLHPFTLAWQYEASEDRFVAAVSCLLLNDGPTLLQQMEDMREKITDSPAKWLESRAFVELSHGDVQKTALKGYVHTQNWMIAALMNELWMWKYEYTDSMDFDSLPFKIPEYRKRLLRLVLSTSDGFGLGLWPTEPQSILCPVRNDFIDFLKLWFPNFRGTLSVDDAIHAFGFRHDYDMYYAWLGFNELMKTDARESIIKAVRYFGSRYKHGTRIFPSRARKRLPEVRFE